TGISTPRRSSRDWGSFPTGCSASAAAATRASRRSTGWSRACGRSELTLLPRHQRLLQPRHVHVVDRARVPHDPAVVAGVVHRLLLRFELGRAVVRLAERERLEPRAHVFGFFDAELLIPLPRPRDR